MEILVNVTAMLLLPLIPAFVLYRTLPSKATVKGPFKGLTINLSGAFAGYFLLVGMSATMIYQSSKAPPQVFEVWRVVGSVGYAPTTPQFGNLRRATDGIDVSILPPAFRVGTDGSFSLDVVVRPGYIETARDFPSLVFRRAGFKEVIVDLNMPGVLLIDRRRRIELPGEITLQPFDRNPPRLR